MILQTVGIIRAHDTHMCIPPVLVMGLERQPGLRPLTLNPAKPRQEERKKCMRLSWVV